MLLVWICMVLFSSSNIFVVSLCAGTKNSSKFCSYCRYSQTEIDSQLNLLFGILNSLTPFSLSLCGIFSNSFCIGCYSFQWGKLIFLEKSKENENCLKNKSHLPLHHYFSFPWKITMDPINLFVVRITSIFPKLF